MSEDFHFVFNGIESPGLVVPTRTTSDTDLRNRVMNRLLSSSAVTFSEPRHDKPPLAHIGSISLMGLSIELEHVEWSERSLEMRVRVPDRDTGAPTPLTFNVHFDPCWDEEQLAVAIIKSIANVVAHEVAEMLFVRGRRCDPHQRDIFFTADEKLPTPPVRRGIENVALTAMIAHPEPKASE